MGKRIKYRFTEKWRILRNMMYPFHNEKKRGVTKTGYSHYKIVPKNKVEGTLSDLIKSGFIEIIPDETN